MLLAGHIRAYTSAFLYVDYIKVELEQKKIERSDFNTIKGMR